MTERPCPACGRGVALSDETWAVMDAEGIHAFSCEGKDCVAKVRMMLGYDEKTGTGYDYG